MTDMRSADPPIQFSFGANWQKFAKGVNEEVIRFAEASFVEFTGLKDLRGHTWLDVGSGSGLSSLVAYRLGARRVVSIDIDERSVECTRRLRALHPGDNWEVLSGSVLDRDFMRSLGRFSFVYSWGVIHHTGAMWEALENLVERVEEKGFLHLAIYNEAPSSERWKMVKQWCNRLPLVLPLATYGWFALLMVNKFVRGRSILGELREYRTRRGMSLIRDVEDWMGGLPYEYCRPERMLTALERHGFVEQKVRTTTGIGCNEFLHRRV